MTCREQAVFAVFSCDFLFDFIPHAAGYTYESFQADPGLLPMWTYRNQFEVDFIREISTLSDRLIGILAPIILEERLRSAIEHRWVNNNISRGTTILEDLLRPTGELGSFGTKVRVGLAVGLYGPESYSDLVRIEKTRNAFAHKLQVKSFSDQPVIDFVRDISINDRWPEERPLPMSLPYCTMRARSVGPIPARQFSDTFHSKPSFDEHNRSS